MALLPPAPTQKLWLIIGASRGLGLEFVRQLLARGDHVIATVRQPSQAAALWALSATAPHGACRFLLCDVATDQSSDMFLRDLLALRPLGRIDHVVINVGLNRYPNHALETSFADFEEHLRINCVGPLTVANKLVRSNVAIGTIVFISCEAGSVSSFSSYEDGFAVFGASKAALNHAIRHMAAELQRSHRPINVLAMHPGDVADPDMPVDAAEIDGLLSSEQSVTGMLECLSRRTPGDSGTFWRWDGRQQPW